MMVVHKQASKYKSVATRLRWTYLLSSVLPLLIVGGILLYLNLDTQEKSTYNAQRSRTQRIARDIDIYLSELRTNLEIYGELAFAEADRDHAQADLADLLEYNSNELVSIRLFDKTAKESIDVIGQQHLDMQRQRLSKDQMAVQKALRFGTMSYGPIQQTGSANYSFLLTIPIRNSVETIVAALQAEINANTIVHSIEAIDQETGRRTLLVVEDTGQVILPLDTASVSIEYLRQIKLRPEAITVYTRADGVKVVGSQESVVIGPQREQSSWAVMVDQPISSAFASTRQSALLLIVFVVLAAIFSLTLAYWQSRRLLQPLTVLREGARALGSGQLSYRPSYEHNDEFGDVVQAFNHMANQLQTSRNKIAQQNQHLLHGLTLARDIQISLLPRKAPWHADMLEVEASSVPAFEVGGDFYNYKVLSQGRIAVVIGDISGKGISAALMMALVSSTIEAQRRNIEYPSQMLASLNTQLLPRLKANKMNVALLIAIFDLQQGLVRIANAGMIAPILISEQCSQLIEVGGLPIGSYERALYQDREIQLSPGDTFVLMSDGIVEAHNAAGELFGFERLEHIIGAALTQSVPEIVQMIMAEVVGHIAEAEPHDDMTVVALRPKVHSLKKVLDKEQAVEYATI